MCMHLVITQYIVFHIGQLIHNWLLRYNNRTQTFSRPLVYMCTSVCNEVLNVTLITYSEPLTLVDLWRGDGWSRVKRARLVLGCIYYCVDLISTALNYVLALLLRARSIWHTLISGQWKERIENVFRL